MSYFAACGNLQQTALIMLMMGTALLQMFIVIEDVTGQRYLFTVSDSILLIVELFYAETLFEVREATAGMGGFAVDVVFLWLLEAGLLVYAAVRYIRMRMRMRYSLSRESIKEGSDNLPDGICFFDEYGAVRLINKKMMAIGIMLFGKEIQTLDEMRSALRDSQSGVECLDRETALYHFPDGTVYRFTESVITDREGKQITEVIAADVTELYAKRKELNCENIRLMDANRRMKEILDNMDDIVREEEILSMKIRVHDDIGHSILAAKKSLIQHQDIAVIRENVVLWETAVDLLYRANNMPAAQDEWQTVKNRAEELGVKIVFEGTLPEEETVRYLLLLAIRECVTNCVRHAGGDRVFVGISDDGKQLACAITNNGRAPKRAVVEGSGLSGLRRRIEREGGTMELEGKPCFVLTITLPLGKFYKESEDSYEKCDDCGRPEDDTKYFGRVY